MSAHSVSSSSDESEKGSHVYIYQRGFRRDNGFKSTSNKEEVKSDWSLTDEEEEQISDVHLQDKKVSVSFAFEKVPLEVLSLILSHFGCLRAFGCLKFVCKKWYRICSKMARLSISYSQRGIALGNSRIKAFATTLLTLNRGGLTTFRFDGSYIETFKMPWQITRVPNKSKNPEFNFFSGGIAVTSGKVFCARSGIKAILSYRVSPTGDLKYYRSIPLPACFKTILSLVYIPSLSSFALSHFSGSQGYLSLISLYGRVLQQICLGSNQIPLSICLGINELLVAIHEVNENEKLTIATPTLSEAISLDAMSAVVERFRSDGAPSNEQRLDIMRNEFFNMRNTGRILSLSIQVGSGVHSPLGQLSCIVDAGILNRPCGILFEKETGNIYVTTFTAPCGRRGVMKFDRYADSLNAAATICPDTEYTYLHVNGRGRNCKIWKERSHDPWDIILQRDETEIDKNGDTQKSFKIIATGRKAQKANLSMGSCFDVNFGPTFCSYFC